MHRSALALVFLVAACGDNFEGNTPPTVGDLVLTTDEDTPLTRTLDVSDREGDPVDITLEPAGHGTVTAGAGGSFTYTPDPNYAGPDSFGVRVSDGRVEARGTVSITVAPINDAPTGIADAFATDEDVPHAAATSALLANDTDVDGDTLSITAVGDAVNGTIAIVGSDVVFTPFPDVIGSGTYRYTVSDGTATSAVTVTITIGGVNDPPVATNDTATTAEDTALVIAGTTLVANDSDAEGQTLTVMSVTAVTGGTVALAGGDVTFTPAANFNGAASFTYTVTDGQDTDTGTVDVTVTAVNDAPVAAADTATTAEDTAVTVLATAMLANDTDVENDTLTITAAGNATNGTIAFNAGDVTFTPAANFAGTGTFEYTVSDGNGGTDVGLVTVTVTAVNDPPVAGNDSAVVEPNIATDFAAATFLANDTDVDGGALSITAVANAVNGSVALAGTTITFTPTGGFLGAASFEYTVSDGNGGTAIATVSVNVVATACGDGFITGTETCDDNDTDPGDGCSAACTVEVGFACTGQPSTCTSICGDGIIVGTETCDDNDSTPGDGCDATCQTETGWTCTGQPSACTTTCGDTITAGTEQCDDGDADDTDGCTTQCVVGLVCNATDVPGADRFATDPATGTCYASFDAEQTTFANAQAACVAAGGHLATITSSAEQSLVVAVQNDAENPWIGASEDGNDTDAVFTWVTGEPFTFTAFAAGQPDDDAAIDGNGDCLHLLDAAGGWNDTNCNITTFVVGRICELAVDTCGDGFLQTVNNESCDDGNQTDGDGCSSTCTLETFVRFSFTGALGDEPTFAADTTPATLAATPTMSRGVGLTASAAGNTFSANNFTTSATLDVDDYYAFTVTPNAGVTMKLLALELDERRSGTGIRTWSIRSSLDGFAADLATFSVPDDTNTRTNQRVFLGSGFAALTAAVEFRIYGFAAEAATGTWRIDNVELSGTAQ